MGGVLEFTDPRLTEIYDLVNPPGPDTAFYVDLADRVDATAIVDLGCGTGQLASLLARPGRRLLGVDPEPAMLTIARRRSLAGGASWVDGAAEALRPWAADLVLMTGHVAQILLDDTEWATALDAIHRTLRPGGLVAFESRNPNVEPWSAWTPDRRRRVALPDGSAVEVWYDVVSVERDRVVHEVHYQLPAPGPELVSTLELRYRTEGELVESLVASGFEVESVFGDWDASPVTPSSPELILVARAG